MQQSKKEKSSLFYDIDELYTHLEYVHNGAFFCCHPNYKSNGEWYDWVMVKFDTSSHFEIKEILECGWTITFQEI